MAPPEDGAVGVERRRGDARHGADRERRSRQVRLEPDRGDGLPVGRA